MYIGDRHCGTYTTHTMNNGHGDLQGTDSPHYKFPVCTTTYITYANRYLTLDAPTYGRGFNLNGCEPGPMLPLSIPTQGDIRKENTVVEKKSGVRWNRVCLTLISDRAVQLTPENRTVRVKRQ